MFYFVKTPGLIKKIYPECVWNVTTNENNSPPADKILYLTFDDGPTPQVTSFVLEELKKYNAKATFFCIGKNVKDNFEVYKQIILEGHKPGNHTFHHLNGWKTNDKNYLDDITRASKIIDSNLFRPPYGRITKFQLKALQGENFKLKTIMWDVLSADFDVKISPENCYLNVINNALPGSIVVFHDSVKAFPRVQYALPRLLDFFSKKNFRFHTIPL